MLKNFLKRFLSALLIAVMLVLCNIPICDYNSFSNLFSTKSYAQESTGSYMNNRKLCKFNDCYYSVECSKYDGTYGVYKYDLQLNNKTKITYDANYSTTISVYKNTIYFVNGVSSGIVKYNSQNGNFESIYSQGKYSQTISLYFYDDYYIVSDYLDDQYIFIFDIETNKLIKKLIGNIVDVINEKIYYENSDSSKIYFKSYDINSSIIENIFSERYENIALGGDQYSTNITDVAIENGVLYFIIGDIQGTGRYFYGNLYSFDGKVSLIKKTIGRKIFNYNNTAYVTLGYDSYCGDYGIASIEDGSLNIIDTLPHNIVDFSNGKLLNYKYRWDSNDASEFGLFVYDLSSYENTKVANSESYLDLFKDEIKDYMNNWTGSYVINENNFSVNYYFSTIVDDMIVICPEICIPKGEIDNSYYSVYSCPYEAKNLLSSSDMTPDGMRVVVNNNNLSYVKGEDVLIAVSEFENNIESYIDKLSVKVSDSNIINVYGIYNYDNLPNSFSKIEELKNCRFIHLKAKDVGFAAVLLTNSETGQSRKIPISVSEDQVATLRASEVKTYKYENAFEEGDYYNAYCDGIWVSDFEYTEAVGGWNFSMNLYNENYSCGVLEVYDADGNLTQVEIIDKFESLTKGLFKCLEAGYTMVEDFFIEGDTFSFRSDTSAKKTPIENIFVPQGGAIIITADPSVSVSCAVTNAFDVLFTACSCADDIGEFIKGIKSLSTKDAKKITACVLAKAIVQEEYLKFGEEFQKDFCEEMAKNISLNMINGLASRLFLKANIFLDNLDISFNEVIKMALGSGTDLAEDLFEKCSGPFGITLKSMFIIQDVMDLVCEINDLKERSNGSSKFGCYTPIAGEGSNILKRENVVVDTNGNTDRGTVLESYIIQSGNEYDDLINNRMCQTNTNYKVYEIAIYNDGTKVQPTGKVTVYIDSPYENATVYRQNEDGTWSKIDSYTKNGMVVFDVDHFCRFIVAEKQYKVNSVSVDNIEMNYKKSATITPIIDADEGAEYTVTYTSSNPSVARVDENGKVYGAKKGSADIIVTVTDSYGNSVSDTCKVNVKYTFGQWLIVIVLFGWIWY